MDRRTKVTGANRLTRLALKRMTYLTGFPVFQSDAAVLASDTLRDSVW